MESEEVGFADLQEKIASLKYQDYKSFSIAMRIQVNFL